MKKLDRYIYTHRRRWGLTQPELAFLLGWESGAPVSRLEKGLRQPKLATVFALVILFGAEAHELFPALSGEAEDALMRRAYALHERLKGSPAAGDKLDLLRQALDRARSRAEQREA